MKMKTQAGIDVVLYIGEKAVAGQQGATLNQNMAPIDITNKIKADWKESLSGLKNWNITCNGMYVVNAESLRELEEAFMNNTEIQVVLKKDNKKYRGQCLITNYPITANFDNHFKYNLKLLGTGELYYENN